MWICQFVSIASERTNICSRFNISCGEIDWIIFSNDLTAGFVELVSPLTMRRAKNPHHLLYNACFCAYMYENNLQNDRWMDIIVTPIPTVSPQAVTTFSSLFFSLSARLIPRTFLTYKNPALAGSTSVVLRSWREVTGPRGRKTTIFRYKMSLFSLYHICYVQRVCYGTDIYDVWRERYVLIM